MLLYFVLGALFVTVGVPLLQSLASIISAFADYVIYNLAFKVYQIKQKMNLEDEDDEQNSHRIPMGFQTDVIGTYIDDPEQEEQEEEQ